MQAVTRHIQEFIAYLQLLLRREWKCVLMEWCENVNVFLSLTDLQIYMNSTNQRCLKILIPCIQCLSEKRNIRDSRSEHLLIRPFLFFPLRLSPLFSPAAVFSLCSPLYSVCMSSLLPCLSFTYLISLLIIFNISFLPAPISLSHWTCSEWACSTPSPMKQELRQKDCRWRSRQKGGHINPIPTGKLSYKFSSLSFFFFFLFFTHCV